MSASNSGPTDGFVGFMRGTLGRVIRALLGVLLIWWGFWGDAGWLVGLIGFVPLAAGLVNFCVFAPLFGCPMSGPKIRAGK
jgi:hypothetical protein